jgi:hypothetical protein
MSKQGESDVRTQTAIVSFREGKGGIPVAFLDGKAVLPLLEDGHPQPMPGEIWEVDLVKPFRRGNGFFVRCFRESWEEELQEFNRRHIATRLLADSGAKGPTAAVSKVATVAVKYHGRAGYKAGSLSLGKTAQEAARNAIALREMVEKGWKVTVGKAG